MTAAALLLLAPALAGPSWGAQVRSAEPAPIPVPPLLVGTWEAAANPWRGPVLRQAEALRGLAPGGLPASAAAAYLAPLASPDSPVPDRMAAGFLSRWLTDGLGARALMERAPDLDWSSLSALRDSLVQEGPSPYRGSASDQAAPLGGLAAAAASDPAVSRLFDGGDRRLSLELEAVSEENGRLTARGARLERLESFSTGTLYAHPSVPGAALRPTAPGAEWTAHQLAAHGLAPRVLGQSAVASRSRSSRLAFWRSPEIETGERDLTVQDRVFGRDLGGLLERGLVDEAERDLVAEALGRAADAGFSVSGLSLAGIMIGSRLVEPQPRAYLMDAGQVDRPSAAGRSRLRRDAAQWLAELDSRIELVSRLTGGGPW